MEMKILHLVIKKSKIDTEKANLRFFWDNSSDYESSSSLSKTSISELLNDIEADYYEYHSVEIKTLKMPTKILKKL